MKKLIKDKIMNYPGQLLLKRPLSGQCLFNALVELIVYRLEDVPQVNISLHQDSVDL